MRRRGWPIAIVLALWPALASAQWDPASGQWLKSDPADLRVMTWNIRDHVCSTADKTDARNTWTAVARIIAAMRPDVLILQEAGDNQGNGTGSGGDSVATLTQVVELLFHGGPDPFEGGQVTAYIQAYAPDYDLPHIFVSSVSDGFNRNIILSRYPFVDLNGDGLAHVANFTVLPHLYAPGGTGGIRGFAFAEIDLPDGVYAGDLVVGNAHLKAGGSAPDLAERLEAAQNTAYYVDFLFNGGGSGVPDPHDVIRDIPPATDILTPQTVVVLGGDWNEDELSNGRRGPVAWLAEAQDSPGADGTDRDRSDATYDDARDVFTNGRSTFGSTSKYDYVAWQDSIAGLRRAFIFNSATIPPGGMPPELTGYPGGGSAASAFGSDHRPVIVDLILPLADGAAPGEFELVSPGKGQTGVPTGPAFDWTDAAGADTYTLRVSLSADLSDPVLAESGLAVSAFAAPGGVLAPCTAYYWGVEAVNASGTTPSTPPSSPFQTVLPADFNGDGLHTVADFTAFRDAFLAGDGRADLNGDGSLTVADFTAFRDAFLAGC